MVKAGKKLSRENQEITLFITLDENEPTFENLKVEIVNQTKLS
jgi:hypothetical protein